jgi:hypothetical protein
MSATTPQIAAPVWMTRKEAAEHLREDTDTVDGKMVPMQAKRVPGKIRYVRMNAQGTRPRLLRADVYEILPAEIVQ